MPSGICGPYTIGRFDRQTNSWLNLGLRPGITEYSRGDRINGATVDDVGQLLASRRTPGRRRARSPCTLGARLCVGTNGVDTLLNLYGNNDDAPTNLDRQRRRLPGDGKPHFTIVNYNNPPVAVNDTFSVRRTSCSTSSRRGFLANTGQQRLRGFRRTLGREHLQSVERHALRQRRRLVPVPSGEQLHRQRDVLIIKQRTSPALSNVATVTITVVNTTQPFAIPDYVGVAKGGTLIAGPAQDYSVLMNDQNGAETAELVTNVSHGVLTFNSDGTFTYIPAQGFSATTASPTAARTRAGGTFPRRSRSRSP